MIIQARARPVVTAEKSPGPGPFPSCTFHISWGNGAVGTWVFEVVAAIGKGGQATLGTVTVDATGARVTNLHVFSAYLPAATKWSVRVISGPEVEAQAFLLVSDCCAGTIGLVRHGSAGGGEVYSPRPGPTNVPLDTARRGIVSQAPIDKTFVRSEILAGPIVDLVDPPSPDLRVVVQRLFVQHAGNFSAGLTGTAFAFFGSRPDDDITVAVRRWHGVSIDIPGGLMGAPGEIFNVAWSLPAGLPARAVATGYFLRDSGT